MEPLLLQLILHISAHPDSVFLIHCSMGKDRTEVIFALLLSLAGVSLDIIAREYSLSEEALEAHLPEIRSLLRKQCRTLLAILGMLISK
ncbi:hypothetical protein BJX70DRAFT_371634 [Aspergillus crustosus]